MWYIRKESKKILNIDTLIKQWHIFYENENNIHEENVSNLMKMLQSDQMSNVSKIPSTTSSIDPNSSGCSHEPVPPALEPEVPGNEGARNFSRAPVTNGPRASCMECSR